MIKIRPLTIAILSIHSSPVGKAGTKDTGGMSTYLLGLSGALGEAGHYVDIFTRAAAPKSESVTELNPGVRLITIDDRLGALSKEEIYPACPQVATAIELFCSKNQTCYDLIFSHYWLSGICGQILAERWNLPHMLMFHTLGRAKNENCPGENEPAWRLKEEERLAYSCDAIITAAAKEKEIMGSYYNLPEDKIVTLPCGTDRDLFRPIGNRAARQAIGAGSEKLILAVGRIEPVKGFELLIKAVALLPFEDRFKLIIAGGDARSNNYIQKLERDAAELGLAEKVIFHGTVQHERLPCYYSAANVTVMASSYESFGLVALESISCGTPVVAGKVGVIPEIFAPAKNETYGQMVEERNPACWAAAIGKFLAKPEKIGRDAIDLKLAAYSWPGAAAGIVKTANNLIATRL